MKGYLLAIAFFAALAFNANGQGTVYFGNTTEGGKTPDGPLGFLPGADFTAQLQFADGTNIGDPAPFLGPGVFLGGIRTVPGVAGGETTSLRVFVSNADGTITGASELFIVTLTNPGASPVSSLNRFHRPYEFWLTSTELIPDPILRDAIRKAGMIDGPILRTDMESLTALNAGAYDPTVLTLRGLEYAINLRSLSFALPCFDCSTIGTSNFSPIGSLNKLEILDLSYTGFDDSSFLTPLTALSELILEACDLWAFTVPATLTSLKKLSLAGNGFLESLTIPDEITSIEELDVSFCSNLLSIDPSFLRQIPNIVVLKMNFNFVGGKMALTREREKLRELHLHAAAVNEFSIPEGVPNLTTLRLGDNSLRSFKLPDGMSNLTILDLSGNRRLADLELGEGATKLENLNLRRTQLSQLLLPNDMTKLQSLDLLDSVDPATGASPTVYLPASIDMNSLEFSGFSKKEVIYYEGNHGKASDLGFGQTTDGLQLNWSNGSLQKAQSMNGPWTFVQNAMSPHVIRENEQQGFFRVRALSKP